MAKLGKRHVATVSFYTYDDESQKAFDKAQKICDQINKDDLRASIDGFCVQEFGTLGSEDLDVNKLTHNEPINEF